LLYYNKTQLRRYITFDEVVLKGKEKEAKEIMLKGTKQYLEIIKDSLEKCSCKSDYIDNIPFVFDEYLLENMYQNEGIEMKHIFATNTSMGQLAFTSRKIK